MLYDDDDGECNAYDFSFQVRTSEGIPPFFFPTQMLLGEIYSHKVSKAREEK